MKKVLAVALGILTAIGGFVDIGDLVTNAQVGARFGLSLAWATVLGVGYVFPMVYFAWSWRYGKPAGNNPFNVRGLEWETTSPPPTFNFDETPIVTDATHSYAHPTEVKVV